MATTTISELPINSGNDLLFTITNTPDANSVKLWRGGVLIKTAPFSPVDYTVSGATITLVLPLVAPDWLFIEYEFTSTSPTPAPPPAPVPPGSTKLSDLIFEAAVMAGMVNVRDTALAPEDANYAYRKVNDLIDYLATEKLSIYREQRVGPFTVAANTQSYTIGYGATWDTARPLWIDRAGVIYTAGSTPRPELPMHVFTTKEWADVVVKEVTSTLPRSLFFDRDFANAMGTITLYPKPSAASQVVLYVPIALTQMPDDGSGNPVFSTAISMPPGYRAMLIANLARILCIGLKPVDDDVRQEAQDTLYRIKVANVVTHMDTLRCDMAVLQGDRGGQWNWLTGEID